MKKYIIKEYGVVESFSELYKVVDAKYVESKREWDLLTDLEQMVLLARWFTMEISGSGVSSIIFGSLGDFSFQLVNMFKYIGAIKTGEYFHEIEVLFRGGIIPKEQEEREQEYLEIEETNEGNLNEIIDIVDKYLLSGDEVIEFLLVEKLGAQY